MSVFCLAIGLPFADGVSCEPMCERIYQQVIASTTVDPITSLTLVLAALSALLTALAIIIGLAAIWGYVGLRDAVKEMAAKKVDEAMLLKLKEYPDSAAMISLVRRLEAYAKFQDAVQNKILTTPDPKTVEITSIPDIQGEAPETPLDTVEQQVTQIEKYPGEEDDDASGDGKAK